MKSYTRFAVIAGLVVGLASMSAYAVPKHQKSGSQAPASGEGSSQAKAAPPKKVNPKEEKAYKAFYNIKPGQFKQVIDVGKAFVKKYPNSIYAGTVYARMTGAYENLGDMEDMLDSGRKALQLNPDNVDVLSLLAYAIPRRVDPNNLNSAQQLQEAAQYATHALALLPKMQKPKGMTEEEFTKGVNAEASSCHSGLGLIDYYQHNIQGMVTQLEQAVKLDPTPDASNQYLLGVAYVQSGRSTDAVGILDKCAAVPGPLASRCKGLLAHAKQMAASSTKK